MSTRRSRLKMSIEVLENISKGEQRPTRLMYACNLSWSSIKNVLGILEDKGYIKDLSRESKRKHLSITREGTEILNYFNGLEELVNISVD